jgi:solute carrier family 35 protein F5
VSVSVSTVLATTSCVWTFILSLALLGERFSWVKAAGVVLTLGGAALVSLERGGNGTWWGIALSLLSAVAYGCYTTALRRLAPEGGGVRIQLLFGFVGVFCAATLGPLSATLHATGALRIPPLNGELLSLILTKGFVDNVLSDLLWAWAIQLTSATLATVGLALTIPTAMVADLLIHRALPGPLLAAGSGLVVLGFVLTTLSLGEREAAGEGVNAPAGAGSAGAADPSGPQQPASVELVDSATLPSLVGDA